MFNASRIEQLFQLFLEQMNQQSSSDRWIKIDDALLDQQGIDRHKMQSLDAPSGQNYFYVLEAVDKITLINQDFIIWLLPLHSNPSATVAMIARNAENQAILELTIYAQAPFNTPTIILQVLEFYLSEIKENDAMLHSLIKSSM